MGRMAAIAVRGSLAGLAGVVAGEIVVGIAGIVTPWLKEQREKDQRERGAAAVDPANPDRTRRDTARGIQGTPSELQGTRPAPDPNEAVMKSERERAAAAGEAAGRDILGRFVEGLRRAFRGPVSGSEMSAANLMQMEEDKRRGFPITPRPLEQRDRDRIPDVLGPIGEDLRQALGLAAAGVTEGAGALKAAMDTTGQGVASAGGGLVGALEGLAGRIAAISIPTPNLGGPINTGTNQGLVR
jgi:hypothetical protein